MKEKPSARSKVVRGSNRAHYDQETLYAVLDAGFLCHISYLYQGSPIIIPTSYVRKENTIYIHGSLKNRMMKSILEQGTACIAVTHLDGLVLARSAFHHSVNYRSAVVFGTPRVIEAEDEKNEILKLITNNVLADRWQEVRQPTAKELKSTMVLAIDINEASVKIREGGPVDDKNDYDLPIWAGELPIKTVYATPIPDEGIPQEMKIPNSVKNAL